MKASNVVAFKVSDATLARWIADVAQDSSNVIIVKHASSQMRKRRITRSQVIDVLLHGAVVEAAHRNIHGNWQCRLECMTAGDLVKVAACIDETSMGDKVIVITAMN